MHEGMHHDGRYKARALASSVAWSFLLHVVVIALWMCLPEHERAKAPKPPKPTGSALIKIKRNKGTNKPTVEKEEPQPPEARPFAKTDSDRPQQRPQKADFEGQRDARAEGMNTPERSNDTPVPTMEGEEKDEVNTLEQERQDGDVEYYGKREQPTPTGDADTLDVQTIPAPEPPAPGIPDATPTDKPETAEEQTPGEQEATATIAPIPQQQDGELRLQQPEDKPEQPSEEKAAAAPTTGIPHAEGSAAIPVQPRRKRGPVYDPSQADHKQPPGLRTAEKRSRSTGQFVLGRSPSLNVEATPRGRYEELIYRLIARQWYAACDTHRGDIIPGTLILAIRINKRGQVANMNLVTRRGAGVIQQSFTFAAIRKAQIPPMPKEVQKTLLGEQMELIITFNFD